jgi:hypothetical protein
MDLLLPILRILHPVHRIRLDHARYRPVYPIPLLLKGFLLVGSVRPVWRYMAFRNSLALLAWLICHHHPYFQVLSSVLELIVS